MMEKQKRILDIIPVEMSCWACHNLGLESNGWKVVGRLNFGVPGPVPDHVTATAAAAIV
jgi:hypothetical protein